ncbi:hypothetical protein Tco_0232423 [Tanacetum coccineum]
MHQPWRSFAAIINKCLSGKTTALESLRLSNSSKFYEECSITRTVTNVSLVMGRFGVRPSGEKEFLEEQCHDYPCFTKYYVIASGAEPPKTKARVKKKQVGSDMSNTSPTKGKRLKTSAKVAKTTKKKQPAKTSKAKGLTVLSEKSSEEDDDDDEVNVSDDNDDDADNDDDVDKYEDEDDADNPDDVQQDDDDDDEKTDSDNDGDDFVHPKLSTHDDEARQDDEEEEMDEEPTHEVDEANELYIDVNVNLEGRDTEMTDAPLPNVQGTQVTEDTHVIITAQDQVKEQVKAQVFKILPKIEKTINEQLEAEVLTCSSNESKTSHVVAANLSELELKKILIDKMESNKKEPESTSAPKEKTSKISGKSYEGSKSQHKTAHKFAQTEEPMHTTKDLEELAHQEFETGVIEDQHNEETPQFPDCSLAQKEDPQESFNELMDTPLNFSAFMINWLKVDTLTPELLTDPTFKLMKGSCKSLNVESSAGNLLETDDDKLYKLKEGHFNRLRIQDIEDMLLLLIQGKLTNLTVEERLAFNVSLRMFTRSVVIQRRVEDLQLGVESYQKKLNLTKPDKYRPDLKRREAYIAYSNPIGFIYQNKDKKNRLMRIDKLHKFSDGTLNDFRTALNDRLKGIRMKYLPQTI